MENENELAILTAFEQIRILQLKIQALENVVVVNLDAEMYKKYESLRDRLVNEDGDLRETRMRIRRLKP